MVARSLVDCVMRAVVRRVRVMENVVARDVSCKFDLWKSLRVCGSAVVTCLFKDIRVKFNQFNAKQLDNWKCYRVEY